MPVPKARLYRLPERATNLIDQLALALDSPKAEIVADAVELYAILYQTAKTLSQDVPSLIFSLEQLLKSN